MDLRIRRDDLTAHVLVDVTHLDGHCDITVIRSAANLYEVFVRSLRPVQRNTSPDPFNTPRTSRAVRDTVPEEYADSSYEPMTGEQLFWLLKDMRDAGVIFPDELLAESRPSHHHHFDQ